MHEMCAFTDIWIVSGLRVTCGDESLVEESMIILKNKVEARSKS